MLNMKQRTAGFALASLLVLCAFAGIVIEKEQLIANGRTVLLELAPADPRSLMQGDYMRLRYKTAMDIRPGNHDSAPKRGYAVLVPDANNVAHALRIDDGKTPLKDGEFLLRWHATYGRAEFVPDSFFFQEGKGKDFQPARYGIFKVGADGDSVLTGLADENRVKIEPKTRIKTDY
jgi:uncharacterized membrane-anchored protein